MRIATLFLLLTVTLPVSCTAPEPPAPATNEVELESVKTVIDGWWAASQATDVDGMVVLMCDDVAMIPPNEEPVTGPDVREFYSGVSERYTFDVSMTTIETVVSGDWAFHQYAYDLSLTPRTEGDPVPQKGYGINILRRRDDDSWCLSRLIWNVLPSPSDQN